MYLWKKINLDKKITIISILKFFLYDTLYITLIIQNHIMNTYYFAIASQDFLLHEEPLEEVLRERINHYKNMEKIIDFWLITNPSFIQTPEMTHIRKQLVKPSVAILSSNPKFIEWIKLRFGFVLIGEFESSSKDIYNLLNSEPITK